MASEQKRNSSLRVGVDTGGTFTDFVYKSQGRIRVLKIASTPTDPARAISHGLKRISKETDNPLKSIRVIHGTTVGTNALLERKGAHTALVTTAGFEDVLEIGRQARPELYNLNVVRPPVIVPEELRFGLRERVTSTGEVLISPTEADLRELLERLRSSRPEAVAVCLLFSFLDPRHEKLVSDKLRELEIPLSLSSEILPEYREFERTSTVAINAYLQPLISRYLGKLADNLPLLRVMQSSGGSLSASAAAKEPVRTILSGPAGGVTGALQIARAIGVENIITFDMGGTSTDVSLCDRQGLRMTNESIIAGLPVSVAMMDIHTVGAGGGSIARVDEGGSLRVGPESAGADPGPACYGRSDIPTVTDANLVLGRFGKEGLLGGEFKLDEMKAQDALAGLAKEMSQFAGRAINAIQAALGVIKVVNAGMERALRVISVERGHDPRDFALVPFGGAGGLHAIDLARALGVPRVIAPQAPGALSAFGAVSSDVVRDFSRTVMLATGRESVSAIERSFQQMERESRRVLKKEGFPNKRQKHERILAMRYKGQSFELFIEYNPRRSVALAFHRAHRERYGYSEEGNVVEVVSVRLRSTGITEKLKLEQLERQRSRKIAEPAYYARVVFTEKPVRAPVYRRDLVRAGTKLRTPCLVTEYSATTLVPQGASAQMDSFGNLIIEP